MRIMLCQILIIPNSCATESDQHGVSPPRGSDGRNDLGPHA